jgi:hypothetical protein
VGKHQVQDQDTAGAPKRCSSSGMSPWHHPHITDRGQTTAFWVTATMHTSRYRVEFDISCLPGVGGSLPASSTGCCRTSPSRCPCHSGNGQSYFSSGERNGRGYNPASGGHSHSDTGASVRGGGASRAILAAAAARAAVATGGGCSACRDDDSYAGRGASLTAWATPRRNGADTVWISPQQQCVMSDHMRK